MDASEIAKAFAEIDSRRAKEAENELGKDVSQLVENEYFLLTHKVKIELKREFDSLHKGHGGQVCTAVSEYVANLRAKMMYDADTKADLPSVIDFDKCYKKLLEASSRKALLSGIQQILERVNAMVSELGKQDFTSAYKYYSRAFVESLKELQKIHVIAAGENDATLDSVKLRIDRSVIDGNDASEKALVELDEAIDSEFADFSNPDALLKEAAEDIDSRVNQFMFLAEKSHLKVEDIERRMATQVEGKALDCSWVRPFEHDVTILRSSDIEIERIAELADLVSESFDIYSQVVEDNGVFGAFSNGEHPLLFVNGKLARAKNLVMPESIKLDGGDNLDLANSEMRKRLQRRYMGILDGDFTYFVDTFWFGFTKLAQFVSEASGVDTGVVKKYLDDIEDRLLDEAHELGYKMDDGQVEAYIDEVENL